MFKTKIIRNVVPLFVVATFVGLVGCKQPTNSISFKFGGSFAEVFWDENSKTATVRGKGDSYNIYRDLLHYDNGIIDKIEKVVLEDGFTSIAGWTFTSSYSNLQSVSIPSSVTRIARNAFDGCPKLTSVTVNAVTPPTIDAYGGFTIFEGCRVLSKIYVPSGSVDTYKNNSKKNEVDQEIGWKKYADKIEAIN